MLDFAWWIASSVLLLLLELAEAVRAMWTWLIETPLALVALGVLLVAVWTTVLRVHRRRRPTAGAEAAQEGTTA